MKLILSGPHSAEPAGEGRWILRQNPSSGARAIEFERHPFVVGRAKDCHLVLPESDSLRASTSRWHCHFMRRDGAWVVCDGGPGAHPETGKPKASITGTRLNGRRIAEATPLSAGDAVEVGPWRFEVGGLAPPRPVLMDAGDILGDVAKGEARTVDAADPKLKAQFGQLHELVQRLAQTPGIEESLTALLSYVTNKIGAAEVAAILLADADGFLTRLAWQKSLGKIPQFSFSQALLKSLPPDKSFMLQSKLKDLSESQSIHDISSGLLVPLWGKGERLGVFYLDNRRSGKTFTDEDLYLASAIASLVSLQLTLESRSALKRIEENMARYFAPDVVEAIVARSGQALVVGLEVQERDVTVLFVDMENFTAMSRQKSPREISEILNPYLESVAGCIQAAGGHVNKFIGDAVMGIFGPHPGQEGGAPRLYAQQAVGAALAIPAAWAEVASTKGLPELRLRIGVNSGRAVVGNIGYSARLEYSVLGDAVNIAARCEKLAPPGRAAVTEATKILCASAFEFEDLGLREVKGVGALKIYSPIAPGK